MPFCQKCGAETNSQFCAKCGTPANGQTAENSMALKCPKCGSRNIRTEQKQVQNIT